MQPTKTNPHPHELQEIINRISAVESAQKDSAKHASDRNTEVQKELVRLDEGLKAVREQATIHNEAKIKAFAEIKQQMLDDKRSLEIMITSHVKELYTGIDKIVNALGLDDGKESAGTLRQNLQNLSDLLKTRKEDILWIRRGVITISLSGVSMLLVYGAKVLFGG